MKTHLKELFQYFFRIVKMSCQYQCQTLLSEQAKGVHNRSVITQPHCDKMQFYKYERADSTNSLYLKQLYVGLYLARLKEINDFSSSGWYRCGGKPDFVM